jgi:hypothetical protein
MKGQEEMAVETIVTTHVHQTKVFEEIHADCKKHKIEDGHDLSWTKNTYVTEGGQESPGELRMGKFHSR